MTSRRTVLAADATGRACFPFATPGCSELYTMLGTRVSAFAVYQKEGRRQQGNAVKKSKHAISKPTQKQKLLKKKRKYLATESETDGNHNLSPVHTNGFPEKKEEVLVSSGSLDRTGKHSKKKVKKVQKLQTPAKNETPGTSESKGLQSSTKHVGPPLLTVLQDLGNIQNSKQRALSLFEWMMSPIKLADFFSNIWEKKPALIKRHNTSYYNGLFSTSEFDRILKEDNVQFGVNLDVTTYTDGKRETHNPPGRALPLVVWDYFRNGCSLRLLNPQAFSHTVWNFISVLQELFGSMVGANTYLTPAGTQGFAPHYDDIEAFVVQLEGKKHWRVYKPRKKSEWLPQFSSANFTDQDIGDPILETILEAGDFLYFPRGFIHQGDCLPDAHSLHITVSSYQRNSWMDLLEKLMPTALRVAAEEDIEFRRGLPLDYMEYMGVQNAELDDARRGIFLQKVSTLMKKLADYAPVDAAVDQKAKGFLHDCLPPVLTPDEKSHSVFGAPVKWDDGRVKDSSLQVGKDTKIRILRGNIARLCSERDSCLMYYSTENSRVYHKEEPKSMEVDCEHVDAIEYLLHSYPKYVIVQDLPCRTLDEKISVATILFEKGLVTTKESLNATT
uniref:Bifunctional lysine-specific demethylase and histidyl-hydroxylase n=1 Tax=Leptobrachium leishanense TaxID=445787 RepID=A0A8C5MYQ6_9ANUR